MAANRTLACARSLVALFDSGSLGTQTDRDLLECFQSDDGPIGQEAFRILVERHGPMVLGLCRSVVRDQHEADDAFQATFLVLVRKAASINRRDTLGPWLYGVAGKVARRARGRLNLRRKREVPVVPDLPQHDRAFPDGFATEQLVHDEIARLPDSIRKPLVLCCLQGLSYDLAAQQLGVNQSTLRRPARASEKTAVAAAARSSAGSVIAVPALESVRAALGPVPTALVESTVQFSLRWSRVTGLLGVAGVVPQSITALAQGVIASMFFNSIRAAAVALLAAGAIGTVVLAQQGRDRATVGGAAAAESSLPEQDPKSSPEHPSERVTAVDFNTKEVTVSIDRHMGARPGMRMMIRDAHAPTVPTEKRKGSIELTSVGDSSSRARILKTDNPTDPIQVGDIVYSPVWSPNQPTRFALMGAIDMNRDGKDDREELKRLIVEAGGLVQFDLPPLDVGKQTGELTPRIDWYVVDARRPLLGPEPQKAKLAKVQGEAIKEARGMGIRPMTIDRLLAYLGHDMDAQAAAQEKVPAPSATFHKAGGVAGDARIRQKLDTVIDADLPNGSTLETLLKHIKKVTTNATDPGIPIYVDPIGLWDSGKTMATEVPLNFKQQPIRMILESTLRPLGLSYDVRDGFLMISSRTAILEHRVEEIDRKLDRLLEMLERLQPAK